MADQLRLMKRIREEEDYHRPTLKSTECDELSVIISLELDVKVKVKEGHTPKERRQGAHLPFIGR